MDQTTNYAPRISGAKSIGWRLLGILYLWIIALFTTGSLPISTALTVVHHTVFLGVFFLQDRVWMRIEWGKKYIIYYDITRGQLPITFQQEWISTKTRSLVKGFVYEIILAIPIMYLIGLLITGNLHYTLTITFIYTFSKVFLYQGYDQLFDRLMYKLIKLLMVKRPM